VKLTSPAFADGAPIPARYTCDGENVSPELHWSDVPDDTSSLALTCEDPDAPRGTFTHWVIWNLEPTEGRIPAGDVPKGARQGRNDFGQLGYGGPCPPPGHGVHRYVFTLYAVSTEIGLPEGATIVEVRDALRDVTLADAQLLGTYER
jgi:Raf kinase inhibitor-like YbhB/YbcL family protein